MEREIPVRLVQRLVALVYAALAAGALARDPAVATAAAVLLLGIGAYTTGRALPDVRIPPALLPRAVGVAAALALAGLAALLWGGRDACTWLAVVMGYGTGNRLRAGALRIG